VMNQMGHEFPNMLGIKPENLEEKIRPLLPAYMTMGHTGMDMGKMAEVMPYPANTISMKGATGPFGDYISMGGLFTIVKVRDRLKSYDEDPGWYQHPPGTVARKATEADLARDGINPSGVSPAAGSPAAPVRAMERPAGVDPHPRH
jgi:manganese oxidase